LVKIIRESGESLFAPVYPHREATGLSGTGGLPRPMSELIFYLHKQPKSRLIVLGFLTLVLLGIVEHLIGPGFFFSIFYLIPIFLVLFLTERKIGIILSIASAGAWLLSNYLYRALVSTSLHPTIPWWNTGISLITFLLTTLILSSVRSALEQEKKLARLDPLTGIANRRFFLELLRTEMHRAMRYKHPFTIVQFDLDNLKTVNDRFGHSTGDAILRLVARRIQKNIRTTDTIARLGGDEFAILLPETGPESAQVVVEKVKKINLDVMKKDGWPITLSMGVVSFISPPTTVDETLKLSDVLMYEAKNGGKNTVKYRVYGDQVNRNHQESVIRA
jgi:diguanylate cyclase (GGDEF)-like protein